VVLDDHAVEQGLDDAALFVGHVADRLELQGKNDTGSVPPFGHELIGKIFFF
jgi:hypothetical protein